MLATNTEPETDIELHRPSSTITPMNRYIHTERSWSAPVYNQNDLPPVFRIKPFELNLNGINMPSSSLLLNQIGNNQLMVEQPTIINPFSPKRLASPKSSSDSESANESDSDDHSDDKSRRQVRKTRTDRTARSLQNSPTQTRKHITSKSKPSSKKV